MTFIQIIIVYKTTFILVIIICTQDSIIQHSIILAHMLQLQIYMAWLLCPLFSFPLLPLLFPLLLPFIPLCTLLPLTWRPPAVTGIVFPLLRLLVNWPYLPHPSPNCPTLSHSKNPNCPTPNNDDIGTAPLRLRGTIQMNSAEKEKQWTGHGTEVKHTANGNWEVFNETRIKVMV
jgi:hypothetical protein